MPFKIVQTIEQGSNKLTTVPEQWEVDGVLYWPKSFKEEKMRKKESSVPDYDRWKKINCIVKRRNIPTFYGAEDEIDAMSNNSETETDTENQPPNKIKLLPNKTFNYIAEAASTSSTSLPPRKTQSTECNKFVVPTRKQPMYPDTLNINQDASVSVTVGTEITEANNLPIMHINEKDIIFQEVLLQEELKENENVGSVLDTETQSKLILDEIKYLKNDIQIVKNNVQMVADNQTVLFNNQNTIITQISELSVKFEEFIKLSLSTRKNKISGESGVLKIYNEETLEEFERKLDQPDSRDEMYRQFSVILNQGIGKGITNAYTLVDAMFERKFFTQCSWTGVSKGDATKICFKGFTKTINFFFNIVYESDKTFNKAQMIKFFKTILRNARYRSQNEQARMSSQRQKQKKSLSTSLQDNLENPSPSHQNQIDMSDLESETNQLQSVPLLQDTQENKSVDADVEVVNSK